MEMMLIKFRHIEISNLMKSEAKERKLMRKRVRVFEDLQDLLSSSSQTMWERIGKDQGMFEYSLEGNKKQNI